MKRFSARQHGRGFTLLEFLIVTAFIGILAALRLRVLSKAKKRGDEMLKAIIDLREMAIFAPQTDSPMSHSK